MNAMVRGLGSICAAAAMAALTFVSDAMAAPATPAAPSPSSLVIDAPKLKAWVESQFEAGAAARKLGPAVFVMVKDGAVVFSVTSGFEDFAETKPVSAETSLFQTASVSKLIAATAIAQLMEKGAIASIDDPANKYLRTINLPPNGGTTITIRHLLTHTAGFEEGAYGLLTDKPDAVYPDAQEIKALLPAYVRPAGALMDYSNAGFALLGLIVQDVTGVPYKTYVERNIFAPLGMTHAQVKADASPRAGLVQSVIFKNGGGREKAPYKPTAPFFAPGGAMIASGADMAAFMIAAARRADDPANAVLSAPMQARMFEPLFATHPDMIGVGMSYFPYTFNGRKVVEHGGDLIAAHSMLTLLPEERIGFFISVASDSEPAPPAKGDGVAKLDPHRFTYSARQLNNAFLSQLLGPRAFTVSEAGPELPLDAYVGDYQIARREQTTAHLPGALTAVRVNAKGALELVGLGPLTRISGSVFQGPSSAVFDYVAFEQMGTDGMRLVPHFPFSVAERVSGASHPLLFIGAFGVGGALLLTGFIALSWPPGSSAAARWGKWAPAVMVLVIAAAFVLVLAPLREGGPLVGSYVDGHRLSLMWLVVLANVAALLAVIVACVAVVSWRKRYWGEGWRGTARRVHYSLIGLGALALLPLLENLKMLGWRLPF